MNTYIFIYEGFVGFETIFTGMLMKSKGDIITVSNDYSTICSYEGFKYIPDKLLGNINIDDVDLFIIPGGNPEELMDNVELHRVLKNLNNRGKVIGAICAAPVHLAKAGILNNRNYTSSIQEDNELFSSSNFIDKDVVVDKNIITAKGNAYLDFAFEIGKIFDVFESEEELQETMNFYRNTKPAIVYI